MQEVYELVINNLKLVIAEKKAVINCDKLPAVFGDRGQLAQLLQNLIGNSLKFCITRPIIHISGIEEKEYYLFSVKDNGIGVESQYFNKIFQIFQRLHSKEEFGGTGIGLAICKRITERHGGKIWVHSKPGEGSEFCFTISKSLIIQKNLIIQNNDKFSNKTN